ncbi:Pro-opiomelanocortin, partial [Campylorhamphus procurvoides]|nr:Pro-opiomelanocortin [Campylorhamphus procurvoides]
GMLLGSVAVLLALLLWNSSGAAGPCWDTPKCRDLSSESGMLACAAACRADLSLESPLFPGNGHLQPLSESIRKYVMSHFRWNKFGNGSIPGSRKREEEGAGDAPGVPIPVFQRREDGKRSYSMEHFRWGKPVGRKRRPVKVYPNAEEEEEEEEEQEFPLEFRRELGTGKEKREEEEEEEEEEESRWESALEKRYGGFLGTERGRIPLLTLFRNAMGKSATKKGQ